MKKILALILAFTLIFILTFSSGCSLISTSPKEDVKEDSTNSTTEIVEEDEDENIVKEDEVVVNVPSSSVIYDLPSTLSFSARALSTGDDESGVASITVNAIVLPEYAFNKQVDWAVQWGSGASRINESVTDYITISPLSDGSTTATIYCYKEFGDDTIIISVTTRQGGKVGYCSVYYRGLPTTFTISNRGGLEPVYDEAFGEYIYEFYSTDYQPFVSGYHYYNDCGIFDYNLLNEVSGLINENYTPSFSYSFEGVGSFFAEGKQVISYAFGFANEESFSGEYTITTLPFYGTDLFKDFDDGSGAYNLGLGNSMGLPEDVYMGYYFTSSAYDDSFRISSFLPFLDYCDSSKYIESFGFCINSYSLVDETKIPYVKVKITEEKTLLTAEINIRIIPGVESVSTVRGSITI